MRTKREYLSVSQVQRELGLSARHIAELIASGKLPAFRILGRWRIERAMLDRFVDQLYDESVEAVHSLAPLDDDEMALPDAVPLPRTAALPHFPAELTDQQRRIVELVGKGMSNAEIAADLSVEVSTVKSHVSRILQRCALRDREQLIVLAWRSGFLRDSGARPSAGEG